MLQQSTYNAYNQSGCHLSEKNVISKLFFKRFHGYEKNYKTMLLKPFQ